MNEKFKDVTDEALQAARAEKFAAFQTALAAANATKPDTVAAAAAAAAEVDEHDAEIGERATVAETAAADLAALQARTFGTEDEPVEPAAEVVEPEEPAAEPVEPEAEVEAPEAPVAVPVAAGGKVAQLARRTARPAAPAAQEEETAKLYSLVAAADSGFPVSSELSWEQVGEALVNKARGFQPPSGDGLEERIQKFQTSTINLEFPEDMIIDGRQDAMEVLTRAADERRLEGNSLVAAGGWCAPSEVLYELSEDESLDGILSLPEVAVKRGGFRYTPGPQFSDFYASPGFKQTEAEAIAGTTKTSVTVTCPTFQDVRLDVIGLWIKVPILTEVGYPELTRRFASGTMTAHEHWKNLDIINRVVALSTSRNLAGTGLGSSVSDGLEAFTLLADQRRQSQRLQFNRSLEVLLPFWVKGMFLNDLDRRNGRTKPATEAELNSIFAARNLAVQWLYDWQVLPSAAGNVTYPTSYAALMYPAGTFVKGTSAVIKLGAIYDAAELATNTYTGSFSEEGVAVAKMKLGSDYLTAIPTCNAGRQGALNFTTC